VRAHLHEGAREIAEGIYHAARTFAAGERQRDDVTSLIMKVIEDT
jgi:serine phosphatase RsbU (regulator of sigma subunit)